MIVDLDNAPRNARGRVEFSTPFFILKPVDLARGNGKVYYTVNNRGNDALLNARTPMDAAAYDFALRLGYTIVDAGWEGDLVPSPTRLAAVIRRYFDRSHCRLAVYVPWATPPMSIEPFIESLFSIVPA